MHGGNEWPCLAISVRLSVAPEKGPARGTVVELETRWLFYVLIGSKYTNWKSARGREAPKFFSIEY